MGWRSGQSYSQDLRVRVLGAVDRGMAVRVASATFGVSVAYIYKALMRRRLTGDAGINPNRGHHPRKLSGEHEQSLVAHMRSRPGITLAQAQAWLLAEHGVQLGTGATWNAVHARSSDLQCDLQNAQSHRAMLQQVQTFQALRNSL